MYTPDEMKFAPIEDMIKELADQAEMVDNMLKEPMKYPPFVVTASMTYVLVLYKNILARFKEIENNMNRIKAIVDKMKGK